MKTLYHPHSDITVEVADDDAQSWVDQGWRKSDPNAAKKTSTKTGEDK